MRDRDFPAPQTLGRAQMVGLAVGAIAAVACLLGLSVDGPGLARAWLLAVVYWIGIPLGCLGLLMIGHLSGGDWAVVARRPFEAAAKTLPLFALLLAPLVLLAPQDLWPWAAGPHGDHLLEKKEWYLNVPFFQLRQVLYFLIWGGLTWQLTRLSAHQDARPDPQLTKRMEAVSAPGLVLLALSVTFASYDWLMSLTPTWYSTMYGVWFMGTMGLGALATLILLAVWLAHREPLGALVQPRHFHDFGKLLLAFVLLWAYFSVSQFLIIWSGNLPDEIAWYLPRFHTSWVWITGGLALLHFALPFVLLLSRNLKRTAPRLAVVAVLVLAARWLDHLWQVAPTFHAEGFLVTWLDVAATLAVGGLWVGTFLHFLRRRQLLPVNDPYLEEAVSHGH